MHVILRYLSLEDVAPLLEALLGGRPDITSRKSIELVPPMMRRAWLMTEVTPPLIASLREMAEDSLFHCRGHSQGAIVVANWSQFAQESCHVLAHSRWLNTCLPRRSVTVDTTVVQRLLHDAFERRSCGVRLTVHLYAAIQSGNITVNPNPLRVHTLVLFPSFTYDLAY